MRTAQIDIRSADGGHADLVIRARMEAGKRIEERHFAACRQTDANADHILFGDVSLAEAVGVSVAKKFGESGILDVAGTSDGVLIHRAEPFERKAVGCAWGDRLSRFVL